MCDVKGCKSLAGGTGLCDAHLAAIESAEARLAMMEMSE